MQNSPAGQAGRLYYLDWLRIIATLAVLLLHCAKIFDYHTTVVFNEVRSPLLSAFREWILLWVMPLFFVISGAAVFFAIKPGPAALFVKSRIKRLLIPLVLVGTFLINPVYVYIERLFQGQAVTNFFLWYPNFFKGMYGAGGNFAAVGHGTHLWYLEFLFIYSLILLPLFIRSEKRNTSLLAKLAVYFERPWALFLLFIPISLVSATFEAIGLGFMRIMGGWDLLSYLLFFSYGYMIFCNERIKQGISKYGPAYLIAAMVLTALHVDSHFGFTLNLSAITRHDLSQNGAPLPFNHAGWIAVLAFRGLIAWCWILGLLGTGSRVFNFSNKFLAYGNEAVLPFYILHHSVIYVVGFYVIQWDLGSMAKFCIIASVSFVVIMAIYEVLLRRVGALRFLFGMKSKNPLPTRAEQLVQ